VRSITSFAEWYVDDCSANCDVHHIQCGRQFLAWISCSKVIWIPIRAGKRPPKCVELPVLAHSPLSAGTAEEARAGRRANLQENRIAAIWLCKTEHFPQERQSKPASRAALPIAEAGRRPQRPSGQAAVAGKPQTAALKVDARCGKPGPSRPLRDVRPITSLGRAAPANSEEEQISFGEGSEQLHPDSSLHGLLRGRGDGRDEGARSASEGKQHDRRRDRARNAHAA
jgi:hypothetical protein